MLYPIIIEQGTDSEAFSVIYPDVPGCFSAGNSYDEALESAYEALIMHFEALIQMGAPLPQASRIEEVSSGLKSDATSLAFVDINIENLFR